MDKPPRKPLRRYTGLKSTGPPQRKTRLKPISDKRKRLMKTTSPQRKAFVKGAFTCHCCMKRQARDCHEIARGAAREKALEHRAAWLALCGPCHEAVDDYSEWPVARQLALKLLGDPEHFDLKLVNELRGRDENAITMSEVSCWLRLA